MISEKINFNFDIQKLRIHLEDIVFKKEITRQSSAFGGWSVLSSNGDYKDGWQKAHLSNQPSVKFYQYKMETEICTGYLLDIIKKIRSLDLDPSRARLIKLSAGMSSVWHTDASPETYAVRLHIPIITNEGCYFETRNEREHLPADGSGYFIAVNREHRVINEGSIDRIHLVMNVEDKRPITQFHQLEQFFT